MKNLRVLFLDLRSASVNVSMPGEEPELAIYPLHFNPHGVMAAVVAGEPSVQLRRQGFEDCFVWYDEGRPFGARNTRSGVLE